MRALWLATLVACGGEDPPEEVEEVDCTKVTNVDTFVVGLDHAGRDGIYDFSLTSITPAPAAQGKNTWVVQVRSIAAGAVGAPVDGATLKVTPYVPAHGHGTGVTVGITPMPDAGQYQLSPIYMTMNGVWETTVRATVGTETDSAVFKFCIP